MEELKNYQEARRYKAVDALFKPTYLWFGTKSSIYGMVVNPDDEIKLNFFEYIYKLYEGDDEVIKSCRKEEARCRKFLDGKISFLELLLKIDNFYTLQSIVLNLEYCVPWEDINCGTER